MAPSPTTFDISSNFPLGLVFLAFLISFLFSVWTYQHTWPPSSRLIRWILTILRWSALTGGIIVISQPVIEFHRRIVEPGTIAVLVDRSESMSIDQGGIDRSEVVNMLLTGNVFSTLQKNYSVRFFSFADSLTGEIDNPGDLTSIVPDGIGTNISRAWMESFEKLELTPPAMMLIISDGAHNSGANPVRLARTAHAPIWTIGIGSSETYKDAMLLQVNANPVVYQGSTVPVEVGYRVVGSTGENLTITLRNRKSQVVGRKQVDVISEYSDGSVTYNVDVTDPGKQRFRVEISNLKDELTTDNNQHSFYLNVLASKMRVLLMSGPPDNGLGDLVRRLSKDEHIELIQRTTRGRSFYEGSWPDENLLKEIDVVILHHFPVRKNKSEQLGRFAEAVIKAELPVGFIDGGEVDLHRLKVFESVLPLTFSPASRGRAGGVLTEGQVIPIQRHAIMADPDEVDFSGQWSGLPPLQFASGRFQIAPHANILAEFHPTDRPDRYPAIVVSETGGVKSVVILGRNLWRWGLASSGEDGLIEPFIRRLIRWLAVRKVGKRVNLQFDKELFSNQESVGFMVTVLNENYLQLDDAIVSAEISVGDTIGSETVLDGIGQGRYRGMFQPWGEGEYRIRALAVIEDSEIGTDQGRITVEPFSIELLDARLNEELLRAVGEFSGGGYITPNQADSLFLNLNIPPDERQETKRWELWGKGWILTVIVILLAVEWFIRIRMGML